MVSDPRRTGNPGFPVDVGQSAPRHAKYKRRQKNSAMVVWGTVGAAAGFVVILIGIVWLLLPGDPGSLTIPEISDQVVTEGELFRLQIPVRLKGREPGQVKYSLGDAPPDATIDGKTGEFCWPTTGQDPGTYLVSIRVLDAGPPRLSDERTFAVRLDRKEPPPGPSLTKMDGKFDLPDVEGFNNPGERTNPFDVEGELTPRNKVDELVFAKLKELKIEPAKLCADAVFLRRVYFDAIGTLPTAEETQSFLADTDPNRRSALIDRLLKRPEFADYWAMKWCDLLRCKAEFPINLWPNGSQAYHRWIRTSIAEGMPYDQFVRELLTSCGSNFRTPQVNFYRAVQSKDPESFAKAVALIFMGVRAENWPKERLASMAVFFLAG